MLQEELDEARIIAEKARSTYDKLRKQRDFQKINHRRVQQEKSKLNSDAQRNKKIYQGLEDEFNMYQNKYEVALKEKMLMKLEKDRLSAKVESLDLSLKQIYEEQSQGALDAQTEKSPARTTRKDKTTIKMTGEPTAIP